MRPDEIMALADAYAQETKDFGHLDNSTARATLLTSIEGLVRDVERGKWIAEYLPSDRTEWDEALGGAKSPEDVAKVIDDAIAAQEVK